MSLQNNNITINKNIIFSFIIILSLSNVFAEEIWEKEIPPSKYLEVFAKNSEIKSEKTLRYGSYALIGVGIAGISNKNYSVEVEAIGYISLFFGGIGLLINKIKQINALDKPRTKAGKEYKKIEMIKDKKEKELLSYQALVFLAEDSRKTQEKIESQNKKKEDDNYQNNNRIKNMVSNIIGDIVKSKVKKRDNLKTYEEQVLDNYLQQKPL